MGFWSEIVGQEAAVATLTNALRAAESGEAAHAWLITGPPGSGRYNIALRFATALVAGEEAGEARLETLYQQVAAGTHPDVVLVRTQATTLTVAQMREVVENAYYAPSVSPKRVIVIEDADRMNEQAANSILKALEEPPQSTVWLLCAPAESDLLPTIRSRTRLLRLVTPSIAEAAQLLVSREGIAPETAQKAARLAQGHIGMAKRLATDKEAMQRRTETITRVLAIHNLNSAMQTAAFLTKIAEEDAKKIVADTLEQEKLALYETLGLKPGERVPRDFSRQFKDLEESAKRRQTRAKIDGADRVLLDILTLARDIITVKTAAGRELINAEQAEQIAALAKNVSLAKITEFVSRLETARTRLNRNMQTALVIEAALVSLITIPNS